MEQMLKAVEDQANEDAEDNELADKLNDATVRAQSDDELERIEGKLDLILLIMQQLNTAVASSPIARFLGR